jgi:outer membrane protein
MESIVKLLKKTVLSLQLAALATCAFAVTSANAEEGAKVAFVNTERILRDAAPARAAQTKLEQEFARRDKEVQDLAARFKSLSEKLDKDAPILSDSDRQRRQRELSDLDKDFQRKQREFREDLNQRRNEELAVVLERTDKVIRQIAETEKYDIVFQDAVYFSPRIDITDKVLKALTK